MAGIVEKPHLHEHALVRKVSEEKASSFFCSFCRTVTTGPSTRYTCDHCDFSLHTFCASCPTTVFNPFHEHGLKLVEGYKCVVCRETLIPQCLDYGCDFCGFYVHPSCHHKATVQPASLPKQVNYDGHDHLLYLVEAADAFVCGKCRESGDGWRYVCRSLRANPLKAHFCIHTYCAAQPDASLQSALHGEHELKLSSWYVEHKCISCDNEVEGAFYICKECNDNFVLHPVCHEKVIDHDIDDWSSMHDAGGSSNEGSENRTTPPLLPVISDPPFPFPRVEDNFLPIPPLMFPPYNRPEHNSMDEIQWTAENREMVPPTIGRRDGIYFFMHPQHELEWKQCQGPPTGTLRSCEVCDTLATGGCYSCYACTYDVHEACSSIKPAVMDSVHPGHILHYQKSGEMACEVCGELCVLWRYHCALCNVHVHKQCLRGDSSPEAAASSFSTFRNGMPLI